MHEIVKLEDVNLDPVFMQIAREPRVRIREIDEAHIPNPAPKDKGYITKVIIDVRKVAEPVER